jgi:hypothetical protein
MTIYLKLLHGCYDPNQTMDGWSFDGPVLGPFEAVHFTCTTLIRCFPTHAAGDYLELSFDDGMLVYGDKYYGDFEIAAAFNDRKLPPDPEGMNESRAEWAADALRRFQLTTGTDDEDAPGDLLCDLMHWCDRNNFDFEASLDRANMHYAAETSDSEGGA